MDPEHDFLTALALQHPVISAVTVVVVILVVLKFSRDVFKKKIKDFPRKYIEDASKVS